jgi:dolichyl-phosphate-mannose-protein mannosyltransferase
VKRNKLLLFSILAALLLRLILAPLVHHGDIENHVAWGLWGRQFGLRGYYDFLNFFNYAKPNQPPLTILLYVAVRYLYEAIFALLWFINIKISIFPSVLITWFDNFGNLTLLKLPSILADIGLGLIIYNLVKEFKKEKAILAMNLYLLNPFVWYNSSVWGQTDSVLLLFGLSSVLLFFKKKPLWGAILLAMTLLFKATLIIFIPIILLILIRQKISLKKLIAAIGFFLGTVWMVAKPFAIGWTFVWVFDLYTGKIAGGELHYLTANAFNLWGLFYGLLPVKDSLPILGIPAFWIGAAIFGILSLIILYRFWKNINLKTLLFSLTLVAMTAFLFLTRMHERYMYFMFAPLAILAVLEPALLIVYIILSLSHFLNLYNFWWVPRIEIIVDALLGNNGLLTKLLSVLNLGIFAWLLSYFLRSRKFS